MKMKQKTMKHLIHNKPYFIVLLVMFVLTFISACSSTKSPVSSRVTVDRIDDSEKLGGRIVTIVQPGDTWHGIAFANGIDVSELVAWNGQVENDKLIIGQRLRLTKPLGFQSNNNPPVASVGSAPKQDENIRIVQVQPSRPSASRPESRPVIPNQNTSNEPPVVAQTKSSQTVAIKPENPVQQNPVQKFEQAQFNNKPVEWTWPLKGKVIAKFSPNLGRKGIDISGKQNQVVKVAAPGKVVYQGNGVKGYRNLIIIKHNENLLSAYAHNQQVYVQEGQWVSANQTISTVGLKNGQPLLHFEIRSKGKPVDPLRYLGS